VSRKIKTLIPTANRPLNAVIGAGEVTRWVIVDRTEVNTRLRNVRCARKAELSAAS